MAKLRIIVSALFLLVVQVFSQGVIEKSLFKSMRLGQRKNVVVSMNTGTQEVLDRINAQPFSNYGEKRTAMASALEANRDVSQAGVLSFLNLQGVSSYESTWISNEVFIKNADPFIVSRLAGIQGVKGIREEEIYSIFDPIDLEEVTFSNNNTRQNQQAWGIEKIQCSNAWTIGKGNGILVGVIDTGVRRSHEAIAKQYVDNNYGWFDPYDSTATPNDGNGHGTHCTGSILGVNNIGVAPEAQWMACKGCGSRSCSGSALARCGEFMLCPTDSRGNNKDCSKAPKIVSNSWGGGASGDHYDRIINAWIDGGIIPVFALGNSGSRCSTTGYPGNNVKVVGVGATTSQDGIADFSSKGPSTNQNNLNGTKPDISAPGHQINSAWNSGDNAYRSISGTSMACPHIAGVAALIAEQKPNASVDDIKKYLFWATETEPLRKANSRCGSEHNDDQYPNNVFGHGRVNAYWANYYARDY